MQNETACKSPNLDNLIEKGLKRVCECSYCPNEIKLELELLFSDDTILSAKNNKMKEIGKKLRFKNLEKAYPELYSEIVLHNDVFFPELTNNASTFLCMKIVDEVIGRFTSFNLSTGHDEEEITDMSIEFDEMQVSGLQYLAGYCVRNLHKKISKAKNNSDLQKSLILLQTFKCDETSMTDQKLISAIDRGGLWGAIPEVIEILQIAEMEFLRRTRGKSVKSIPLDEIIDFVLKHERVSSLFILITAQAEVHIGDGTDRRRD